MTDAKPLAFDLLYRLESILESDPLIDEVGFIHPSQFVALSECSEIPSFQSSKTVGQSGDGIVESRVSEVNTSDMVFWSKDHKLGISTQALHSLYNAAKHAFMASREQYKMLSNLYVKNDGHGNKNVSSCSSSSPNSLESEVMKHSRALLLLSSDFGTAWNSRKDIVSKKQHFLAYVDELILSELVLSYAQKSEPAWSHRCRAVHQLNNHLLVVLYSTSFFGPSFY